MCGYAHGQFAPNTVLKAADLNAALARPTIVGGTINGTPIGALVPSSGNFTTVTMTGGFTSRGIQDNASTVALVIDLLGRVSVNNGFTVSGNTFVTRGITDAATSTTLTLDSGGYVGIGTGTPSTVGRLAVVDNNYGSKIAFRDAAHNDGASFGNDATGSFMKLDSAGTERILINSVEGIRFGPTADVMIGGTVDNAKLSVDSGNISKMSEFNSTSTQGGYLSLTRSAANQTRIGSYAAASDNTLALDADSLYLRNAKGFGFGRSGAADAAISLNGNMLLGSTTDDGFNKLQINGAMTSAGTIESKGVGSGGYQTMQVLNTSATGGAILQLQSRLASVPSNAVMYYNSGTTLSVGTVNTDPVVIFTNNTERFRANATGALVSGTIQTTGDHIISGGGANPKLNINDSVRNGLFQLIGGALDINNSAGNVTLSPNGSAALTVTPTGTTVNAITATSFIKLGAINILPSLSGTSALIGGSALAAGACTAAVATGIAGVTSTMVPMAAPLNYPGDQFYWTAVASANIVSVRVCAVTAGTPPASTYNIRVIQ